MLPCCLCVLHDGPKTVMNLRRFIHDLFGAQMQRIARSMRQEISALRDSTPAYVSSGSKPVRLRTSKCFPLCPRKRTSARCAAMSEKCQEIGIGGSLAAPPLPHHRTYGSVYGGSRSYA